MTYSMVVAAFSTTVLCSQQRVTIYSNIDRMRTALWPNVNFKLYIGFYNVFVPSCDT